jgi:Tudor domain
VPTVPQSGSLVAVKSSIDSKMYRAVVKTHTSQHTALVFFLDFGNREEVHVDQIFTLTAAVAKVQFIFTSICNMQKEFFRN